MPTDLTPRAPPGVERRWSFGPAVFDERTMELRLSGEPVAIERKALQLLMHLLRHAGEVVTKDELQAAVWPGCSLSDSVLTKCMARLREALHDESQGLVKTVHGFGYRLIAPVSVATDATPVSPRFEFHAGERLPSRPLWSLVERLGTGGYGEAWLARQDRTGEQRVYKFAVDEGGLTALKREITIYRLLHDTLGERPDLTRLLEWNVEEPPYFLEYEHVAGGSLSAWAMERGGIDRVPLAERLDIAAQVAGALAAAHSVGVLHKDLKPSNILLEPGAGAAPRVRLCDFGSGGILDVRRLDQLGITRLGFTRTLAQGGAPATPLYLAPEVLAGQPFTVRADVYAVGVILYQLAVGNLQKPIASGWEQDVPDEVLRSDIALAVDGEPARRIADAGDLAQRLRSLDRRREELARGRAAQAAVKQTGLEMERAIARRKWVRLTIAALLAGVAVSSALYVEARRARDEAAASAASVRAVNDFLTQDMFAQISSGRPLRSLTVKEVLDGASTQVDARFAGQPAVAAMIHASLGSSYVGLDEAAAAERELDRALALALQHEGPASLTAVAAVTPLMMIKRVLGKIEAVLPQYQQVLDEGARAHGAVHPQILRLRLEFASPRKALAEQPQAVVKLRGLLAEATGIPQPDGDLVAQIEMWLGYALYRLAEHAEAEPVLRSAVARLEAARGPDHPSVARVRHWFAAVLTATGRYDEAEAQLRFALATARKWAPSDSAADVLGVRQRIGQLRLEQGRVDEAVQELRAVRDAYMAWTGPELDQSYVVRLPLAEAYLRQHRLADAEAELRHALTAAERRLGRASADYQRLRVMLADVLQAGGRHEAAAAELARVSREPFAALPPSHPHRAELRRVEGLIALQAGARDEARAALGDALRIMESCFDAANWRVQRLHQERAAIR